MRSRIARRSWIAAFIVVVMAAVASAQTTKPSTQKPGTDQQVRAAQQQLLQAAIQGDKDYASKFVADDVTWVGSNGQVMDKEQMLAALPAPVHTVDVQQVLPMGKTAILVAVVHLKDGTERRALQEWVNRDGEWKVMAHQSTPISAEGTPTAGTMGTTSPTATSGKGVPSASELRTVAPTLNSDAEQAIWRAQMDMVEAYSRGDVTSYSRLTANPFLRVQTNGQFYNRRQWLDLVRNNAKEPLRPGAVSDVQIKVDGDVARATMQIVPFRPDGTAESPERQTRIFARRNGRWQQVAAISTPLSQQ